MAAIETCHRTVSAMGHPRLFTMIAINTRADRDQTLEGKVVRVEALLPRN
ncbi:thiamine-binding protein [Cyanobium sp. Morenito 9A2]|nr:thiamine-binding protein [Cyanobium sp. Morenito 9A2]